MQVGLKLLLADFEKARAVGDSSRARSIFKQMEKIGLPDHLKPKPGRRASTRAKKPLSTQEKASGIKIDPGRF